MAITKAKLTELIRRRLSDGDPTVNDRVKEPEIHLAINMAANKLLKTEAFNKFTTDGETLIDGVAVQTYERIPVQTYGKYSRASLPVTPLQLPNGMGVFSVCESGNPESEYIPIPLGVYSIMRKDKLLSNIQHIFYTYDNQYVTVYSDLPAAGIKEVDMRLCTMDIEMTGLHDPLPLDMGMEADIVVYVLNLFNSKQTAQQ